MHKSSPDSEYFRKLQTQTGWGRVLSRFGDWLKPQAGWLTLDVGCGPGLLPVLMAKQGCRALGIDFDFGMFSPNPLHPDVATADGKNLPFPEQVFDLVTTSNLLFLLSDPLDLLHEVARVVRPGGCIGTLNPTEYLTLEAVNILIEARNLTDLVGETLLNWAARAETHFRWTEEETTEIFNAAGVELVDMHTSMGPGFTRFARGVRAA